MSAKKLISVFGATGSQGGSVARALLAGGNYNVRAITRNAASDKAKHLAQSGAEVREADLDNANSLVSAVEGSHGVFLILNFWEHSDMNREIKQGRYAVNACRQAGVDHLVFSGADNVKKSLGIPCPHFDGKAELEDFIKAKGVPFTNVHPAGFMENLLSMMAPRRTDTGEYVLDIPMEGLPMYWISVTEIGECVHQIFKNSDQFMGKSVGLASDKLTIPQVSQILQKQFPDRTYVANDFTADAYSKLGFPGADDLGAMFKFYQGDKDMIFDIEVTKSLNPNIPTMEEFIAKNIDSFK